MAGLVGMFEPIRVFVGTDRSQSLAVKVLEYSIRRHTAYPVELRSMADLRLPAPRDIRQGQRTGFSFSRWAIPELCHYQGRAIYLDADMLVFRDIAELWNVPLAGRKIAVLEPKRAAGAENVHRGKNETSVMLLDCGRCKWTVVELIAGLDGRYTYPQMMRDLCFLAEDEIARSIPEEWNAMEHFTEETGLIHYTVMPTQPWVSPRNGIGHLWIAEVRRMIAEGALSRDEVQAETDLGFFRPSLVVEIDEGLEGAVDADRIQRLEAIDASAGYVPHRSVQEFDRRRLDAVHFYERCLARERGMVPFLAFVARETLAYGRSIAGRAKRRMMNS
jgi:hypothetical protein